MALVRCQTHGKPEGTVNTYVTSERPLGYPDTAAVCGRKGCNNPGLLWLTQEEQIAYASGQRIFAVPNAAMKIKVK